MGLALKEQQYHAIEAISIGHTINTRLLLTLATVKKAPAAYQSSQEWLRWLYLESSRVRAALGPFAADDLQTIQFRDGASISSPVGDGNTTTWALTTSLGAGKTQAELEQALAYFNNVYTRHFGSVAGDEGQLVAAATMPFLYKPYDAPLRGRGYYDHTYPSIDYSGGPNVPGMRDYLGRSNVNYDRHDGDDFWIDFGSNVYAPLNGRVVYISTDRSTLAINDPSNTYQIVLAHMSQISVSIGSVTRGQLLGKSGAGNGVNHIHLDVTHNGKHVDTMGWYGGGADPCPAVGPSGAYKGCEASVWLWADENPPSTEPVNQPPNVPSLLAPANHSLTNNTRVTFAWQDRGDDNLPRNYRDYWFEVRDTNGTPVKISGWVTSTSREEQLHDGVYSWHVKAGDGERESGWSAPWYLTVDTSAGTGVYTEPADGTTVANSVLLRGTATDNLSAVHHVNFTAHYDGAWHLIYTDTTPPYEYQWTLPQIADQPIVLGFDVFDNAGNAAYSPQGVLTIYKQATVTKPSHLSAGATTRTSISLNWQDNSHNESSFRIYRWRGEDQTWPIVGTVGANITTFTDTTVRCGVGYTYYVTAFNSTGESEGSEWLAGSTSPCDTTSIPLTHMIHIPMVTVR